MLKQLLAPFVILVGISFPWSAGQVHAQDPIPELDPVRIIKVFKHQSETLSLSKDGKRLAVVGEDIEESLGKSLVRVIDLKSAKTLQEFPAESGGIIPVAYSPDGKQLAFGGGQIGVVNSQTGRPQGRLERATGGGISETQLEFSPDGKFIWTFDFETVVGFDAKSLREVRTFPTKGRRVCAIGMLPTRKMLAVGYNNGGVRLYPPGTKKEKEIVLDPGSDDEPKPTDIAHRKPLKFAETVDGKWLVVSRFDLNLELWDLDAKEKIREFSPAAMRVDAMEILGGNRVLVALGKWVTPRGDRDFNKKSQPLIVFDMNSGKAVAYLKIQDQRDNSFNVWSMQASADDELLYVATENGSVQVFDVSRWSTASSEK